MKTKLFLSLCLIVGIASTQLFAQNVKHKTVEKLTYVWYGYYQPVYCDGILVDWLIGAPTITEFQFFEDGVFVGWHNHFKGEVISERTKEVFKVHEEDTTVDFPVGTTTWHFNLIGNKGHHYIGWMVYDWLSGQDIPIKTVCAGN